MDTGLTSDYISRIREEVEQYGKDILDGKCKDMESYKFKVGYMQGLQMAERLLHDTIKHIIDIQNLDDDDD